MGGVGVPITLGRWGDVGGVIVGVHWGGGLMGVCTLGVG